jgi:hypothetical protein
LSKITWISRPAWSATKAVHEIQELDAPAALVMAGLDQASGNIERGEQGRGPVPIVGVAEPCHRFAIGQLNQPWARSRAWMCGFSSTENTTAFSGGGR